MATKIELEMGRGSMVCRQKLVGSTTAVVAEYREEEMGVVTKWPQW